MDYLMNSLIIIAEVCKGIKHIIGSKLGLVQTRDKSPGRDTEMAVPFPVTCGRDKMGTMGT